MRFSPLRHCCQSLFRPVDSRKHHDRAAGALAPARYAIAAARRRQGRSFYYLRRPAAPEVDARTASPAEGVCTHRDVDQGHSERRQTRFVRGRRVSPLQSSSLPEVHPLFLSSALTRLDAPFLILPLSTLADRDNNSASRSSKDAEAAAAAGAAAGAAAEAGAGTAGTAGAADDGPGDAGEASADEGFDEGMDKKKGSGSSFFDRLRRTVCGDDEKKDGEDGDEAGTGKGRASGQ